MRRSVLPLVPALFGLILVVLCALSGCTSSSGSTTKATFRYGSSATNTGPTATAPLPSTSATTSTASAPTPTGTSPDGTPSKSASGSGSTPAARRALVVVLDPGHNGGNGSHPAEINKLVPMGFGQQKPCNTTGTNTDAGYPEHAFTWDVSLRVRTILRAHGIDVVLTRPNDTGVGPCVDKRGELGNGLHAAAVVAIHADGAPSSGHGFHVNTASRRPAGASEQTMQLSQDMAVDIHDALTRSSGLVPSTYIGTNGYFRRSDLAGLNLSTRPTTFLELGNMRNAHDAALDSSVSGRQQIADAVAAGILTYLAAHP